MGNQISVWRCGHGHILGQVVRNGSGIKRLLLYRQAVGGECDPAEVDVMAVINGLMTDVTCSVCGDIQSWDPGQRAIEELIRKFEGIKGR